MSMSSQASALLAVDQGTTSSRAIVFRPDGTIIASAQRELPQIFPQDGWVEHDPERIASDTVTVMREALAESGLGPQDLAGIGITNQRETTVLWDRATGKPVHNAIVWQDRRTAAVCQGLAEAGHEPMVQARTGLLLDPYFSATKLAWLLDTVPGARARAAAGELAFGTIDSWLIWCLTGGRSHVTDVTNAARTLLLNLATESWDPELLTLFRCPAEVLPKVKPCTADFGETIPDVLGSSVPILGVAGDQQAATIGQACFEPGMMKSTYGTGCFALLNTGERQVKSKHRLLTTIAYRIGDTRHFAVEGSIFMAGATLQWVRDGLGLVTHVAESEDLARSAKDQDRVYLVPAFTGLGAPYWDPNARGGMFGMTRDTGRAEIVRAAIDSVCYQTRDLFEAMDADLGTDFAPGAVRIDGGMAANRWFVQRLADITGRLVECPKVLETTSLGACVLAGLQSGIISSTDNIASSWESNVQAEPVMPVAEREDRYGGWKAAVGRILTK